MTNILSHADILADLKNIIIPAMQSSKNAEDTLLKKASELNYSPALLEYAGHLINTIKANSIFQGAKSAEDRGSTCSLLDVDALKEKYAQIHKELDNDTKSNKSIDDFMKLFDDNKTFEVSFDKAASCKINEDPYDLSVLFKIEKTASFDIDKQFEDFVNAPIKPSDISESEIFMKNKFAQDEDERNLFEAMSIIADQMNDIEYKFANYYNFASDPEFTFDELEHDSKLLYKGNDKDLYGESIDTLHKHLSERYSNIDINFLKRANDCQKKLANRNLLRDDNKMIDYVNKYHDLNLQLKIAKSLLEKTSNTISTAPKRKDQALVNILSDDQSKNINNTDQKPSNSPEIVDALNSVLKSIGDTNAKMVDNVNSTNKWIFSQLDKTQNDNKSQSKQDAIESAIKETTANAIFNDLMFTDDVLSTLSDDQQNKLTEIYASAIKVNPELATNKAAVRSFLRSAAQVQGFDLGSVKMLADIRKTMNQK